MQLALHIQELGESSSWIRGQCSSECDACDWSCRTAKTAAGMVDDTIWKNAHILRLDYKVSMPLGTP